MDEKNSMYDVDEKSLLKRDNGYNNIGSNRSS